MSKLNTTKQERTVDGQQLMKGDRVDSGYNQRDVFYQLRTNRTQWFIYCHNNPSFEADPLYEDNYDEWLEACEGTPNHPIALDNGWVIVGIESTRADAEAKIDTIDQDRVASELSTANINAFNRVGDIIAPPI